MRRDDVGLDLRRLRHGEQAVFAKILKRSSTSPDYYRRNQREWIDLAKRESRA